VHVCEASEPADVRVVLREFPEAGPAVVLEPESLADGWPPLEDVPASWGPTPVPFTTHGLSLFPDDRILAHEVFACYPAKVLADVHGPLNIFVAPPIARFGALIYVRDGLAVCTLRVADAYERGESFARTLVANIARLLFR
jgi:hypothetical protein